MKLQSFNTEPVVKEEFCRKVSLAEAKYAMGEDVVRLPAAGFWTPMVSGMSIGFAFPECLPLDYDGMVIWPRPVTYSAQLPQLAQILGLADTLEVELWVGRFDFSAQCFELTLPQEAEHLAMFVFDSDAKPLESGLSDYILKYADQTRPMICQAVCQADGRRSGFVLVEQLDEENEALCDLLAQKEAHFRQYLQKAEDALKVAPQQQEHCRATMATLMAQAAVTLDWGWCPMADAAWVYYINGDGEPVEEVFFYVQRDVDYLCNLICIAEEANATAVIGEPEKA